MAPDSPSIMIGVYRGIGYHCYQTLAGAFTARGVSLGSWIDGRARMDCLECSLHLEEFDGYTIFQERRDLRRPRCCQSVQ